MTFCLVSGTCLVLNLFCVYSLFRRQQKRRPISGHQHSQVIGSGNWLTIIAFGHQLSIGLCVRVLHISAFVGRVPDYRAGGRGFKPRPDHHSGSLNN